MQGKPVGRRPVSTRMTRRGIHALDRTPRTSPRPPAHTVDPARLRQLEIARPHHVWAADITYIPMKRGVGSLFAVLDWASRRVRAWQRSHTLTTAFCLEAVQEALARDGPPAIFHTDQGSPLTSREGTRGLNEHRLHISLDGTGCWRDTVCGA